MGVRMKIINFNPDVEEKLLVKRGEAVIELNKEEQKLFKYILKNMPAGNKPLPEIGMGLEKFCLNCGCTEEHACKGGCSWVAPYKCSNCYDENGYRIK